MPIRALAKAAIRQLGIEVSRASKIGMDAFLDMSRFVPDARRLFDVGANIGQTAKRFRETFPQAEIHCFEPSPSTFERLKESLRSDSQTHVWNCGLGSALATQRLYENTENPDLNSFLPAGPDLWETVAPGPQVPIESIDDFCERLGIETIDVLKTDTQGYDLEVLRGACGMLGGGRVKLLYLEINFARLYEGQASFGEEYDFITNCGFRLLSLYSMHRLSNGLLGWTDALFVHETSK